jgi:DUF1365 family protein
VSSEFYISFVRHIRYFPRRYEFDYNFFWAKFDLDELDELENHTSFFSRNRFNLLSFYDNDHFNLGFSSTRKNVEAFLRENEVNAEVTKIELFTNPRVLGYTFKPVSFFFIETSAGPYLVIEIGNTFNERKPYLVAPQYLTAGTWTFTTPKHFYVSPFTSVENTMTFRVRRDNRGLVITIDDFDKKGNLEVRAVYSGKSRAWSRENILKLFFSYPLITLRIIWAIHYHALKLFILKVPHRKKTQDAELQTNVFVWRKGSFRREP